MAHTSPIAHWFSEFLHRSFIFLGISVYRVSLPLESPLVLLHLTVLAIFKELSMEQLQHESHQILYFHQANLISHPSQQFLSYPSRAKDDYF